jgi:hypothetical protein
MNNHKLKGGYNVVIANSGRVYMYVEMYRSWDRDYHWYKLYPPDDDFVRMFKLESELLEFLKDK